MNTHPHIRSFASRQGRGRLSEAQRRALDTALPDFDWAMRPENWVPEVVEIGFGNGEALLSAAINRPDDRFLGIEVYPPGVGHLLARAAQAGVANLRVAREDAILVLPMLPDGGVREFRLWFPDPWPKKRHHKRRIVQPEFVATLTAKLRPDGVLHFATDVVDYAAQMLEVLSAEPRLLNLFTTYAPRPESRPLTRFEQRGVRLGHEVRDLLFKRKG